LGGLLVATMLVATVLFGAAGRAPAASRHYTGKVSVPLPAPGHDEVVAIPVKVTAAKGKQVRPLRVRTINAAELGGNVRADYVIEAPRKLGPSATFNVYVLIKQFAGAARAQAVSATTAQTPTLNVSFEEDEFFFPIKVRPVKDFTHDCDTLSFLNTAFEGNTRGTKEGPRSGRKNVWMLAPALPASAPNYQTSDPEEVLDHILDDIWLGCPGAPETFDSGPH
jgi:hypothetical protein